MYGQTDGILSFQYDLEGAEAEKNVIPKPTDQELSRQLRDARRAAVAEGRREIAALREQQPVPQAFRRLSFGN